MNGGERSTPDVRGGKPGLAVLVEPAGATAEADGGAEGDGAGRADDAPDAPPAFLPLDPAAASPASVRLPGAVGALPYSCAGPVPIGTNSLHTSNAS